MDKLKSRYEQYTFKGSRQFPTGISARAVVDLGPIGISGENVVEMRTGAGAVYPASEVLGTHDWYDQNYPTSIYIMGTENYNGLRRIHNLRQGIYPQFYAPFVAETIVTAFFRIGYKAEVASEFGGFRFTADAVTGSDVDLVITNHSNKGAAFDNVLYTKNLNQVTNINHMFKPARFLAPGDRIDVLIPTSETVAISLFVRKLT